MHRFRREVGGEYTEGIGNCGVESEGLKRERVVEI